MPLNSEQADRLAVVIPAYRPSAGLVELVRALSDQGAPPIVIVDDGSGPEYREVFSRAAAFPRVQVLRHAVNLGKGAALKTAINHVLCTVPALTGIVTADADGQHHPDDILKVADTLAGSPESLVLGSRSFDGDVPLRSRIGNVATRGIMHALLGQKLTDTQTGLRGIPASFLPKLLRHEATGYEFELEMLIAAHQLSIPMVEAPIRTIYEAGNKSSHFNPIIDSMKIYFVLLRFGSVSLLSALLDSLVYILVWNRMQSAIAAQVLGRLVSVCFNYSMVRSSVFYSHQRHKTVLPKYLLLVAASGMTSFWGIHFLRQRAGFSPIPAKLMVETVLFFVNFGVQRLFIFKPQETTSGERRTAPALIFSVLVAVVFVALLGVEIYGFTASHLFTPDTPIWYPIGLRRFLRYGGAYLALAVPLLLIVPWTFAPLISALLIALTAISVGPQPLLATAFFLISACALGSVLLGRRKAASITDHILAALLGTGVYVFLMIFLARLPVNYPAVWGVLLAIPVALDAPGVWRRLTYWASRMGRVELRSGWERAALAFLVFILVAHWFVVLKPETSADGLAMHLAVPMNIAAHHRMTIEPGRFLWSVMPMGADWAYSIVYLLGGEYAPRILNYSMLLIVVALLYGAARRWVSPAAGFLLAASFAATPIVQFVTGSLFVENYLTAMVFGLMLAIWRFGETGDRRFLYLAAVAGGAAMTAKYGALAFVGLAVPFAIAEIARHWKSLGPKPRLSCAIIVLLLLTTSAPTYVIAYAKTGNPIFPFLNTKIHSPLLDPGVVILDGRFRIPVDWSALYSLTFHTSRSYEGQNGSFGFQYLIVAPLVLLGLLVFTRRPAQAAAVLALGGSLIIMLSTPNARYLYTAMAILPVPLAALLGWMRSNQRWMYRVLLTYLVACTALNAYFLPSSNYYHKDFCLRLPFSRAERESYKREAAPIRGVISWFDSHHPNSPVLLTTEGMIAGLTGEVYVNHWHQYPTFAALRTPSTLPDMVRLMERWKVAYFITPKPTLGQDIKPARLEELLERCTEPEYEYGEYYLAHLEATCGPAASHPLIVVPPGLYDDFDPAIQYHGDWEKDGSFEGPDRHTISYAAAAGADVTFAFDGKSVTYIFTKAPNRGIAAVTIDGVTKTLDLYSPDIQWQVKEEFCCFAPGRHLVVIAVSGQKNPKSEGVYVDLDSFLVK